jgi:hypothetical protein
MMNYDESRLIGYVARFKREIVNQNSQPTGFDDLLDWLEMNEWDVYGEDSADIVKVARREWMRG